MSPSRKTKKVWVRLSEDDLDYLRQVMDEVGLDNISEAIRFIIRFDRRLSRSERILIPGDVIEFLRGGFNERGREEGR